MKLVRSLFGIHLFTLVFGLVGLVVVMPHPEVLNLVGGDPSSIGVAQRYTGALYILAGAAAMLAFGLRYLGARKTLIFFVVATLLPLGMELLGTGTGWPFGAYSYTANLGYKVGGRVPFSIPLSWFYMGFTAYLLASVILSARRVRHVTAWSLVLGAWFLTAWDLVLDPAMASDNLPFRFWIWHVSGIYYGMPLQNFIGWSFTGLLFMTVARLLWRGEPGLRQPQAWFPFAMYSANMLFAFIISLSVGLWQPIIFAVLFGLVPAALALRSPAGGSAAGPDSPATSPRRSSASGRARSPLEGLAQGTIHSFCRTVGRRSLRLRVEGLEQFPASGPVLVASRHYHHLYDGCALMTFIPRHIHILVALDWVRGHLGRGIMEWACRTARWPAVLRSDAINQPLLAGESAYQPQEARRYLRRAVADAVRLLREGEIVVVFPEAYPNVDPSFTPKASDDAYLPFRAGVTRLVELAQRDGVTRVQIVPAGLAYLPGQRWQGVLRLGAPLTLEAGADATALLRTLEEQVRTLSAPLTPAIEAQPQQAFQV